MGEVGDMAAGAISSTAAPMTNSDLARVIGKMDSPALTAAIILQQRAELERLREALELIHRCAHDGTLGVIQIGHVARAALHTEEAGGG